MLCFKTSWLVFIFAPIFFTCGSKKNTDKNTRHDTTNTRHIAQVPDETQMLHFTSIYQTWIENGTIKDTLNFVHIWYDGQFIIAQDTTNHAVPKFTLEIGEELKQPNLDKYKQLGGVDPQTAYTLKNNNQGYHQLIVFKSEHGIVKKDIKYTHSFTLEWPQGAKIYFSSLYTEFPYKNRRK